MMIPAGAVESTIEGLVPYLDSGDILIDGGNSYYIDDIRRAKELAARELNTSMSEPVVVYGVWNEVIA